MSSAHRRRGGHAEEHEEEGGMERWLLTYADMITLLLALFVVLFALSSINIKKFLEFKMGLTKTFNPTAIAFPGSNGLLDQTSLVQSGSANATKIGPQTGTTSSAAASAQLQRIAARVSAALSAHHLAAAASVSVTRRGVVVQVLADKAFFATDSAALGDVGDQVVDTIAGVIRRDANHLVVQGYTDNEPIIGGPYNSNWELSAVRAANVVNRLNVVDHIAQSRLSAQGYGQTHPVVPNLSAADRAQNRRVDVVILSTSQG